MKRIRNRCKYHGTEYFFLCPDLPRNHDALVSTVDGKGEAMTDTEKLELAKRVIKHLNRALAEIETRCGSSQYLEAGTQQIRDIYEISRIALENVGVPSSELYWGER